MAVGPLAQSSLNEALGLAIGLWPIGSRELVFDPQLGAGLSEGERVKGRSVVGEHALYGDTQRGVIGDGSSQEAHGAVFALIGVHVGESDARMVVDGHKQVFPAHAAGALAIIGCDSMTHSGEAAQLLDVDVEQFAGRLALVPLYGLRRGQIAEP